MDKIRLSDKQQKIYEYIQNYRAFFGRSPTRGEIARIAFSGKISRQAVDEQLRLMEKKGWIRIAKKQGHRNIKLRK